MGPRPERLAQSATHRFSDQQRFRAQDRPTRYPHFYADISALTLPNRLRMLLHLRRYPEVHEPALIMGDREEISGKPDKRRVGGGERKKSSCSPRQNIYAYNRSRRE